MRFGSVASQQNVGRAHLYVAPVTSALAHALPFVTGEKAITRAIENCAFPASGTLNIGFILRIDVANAARTLHKLVTVERALIAGLGRPSQHPTGHRHFGADGCIGARGHATLRPRFCAQSPLGHILSKPTSVMIFKPKTVAMLNGPNHRHNAAGRRVASRLLRPLSIGDPCVPISRAMCETGCLDRWLREYWGKVPLGRGQRHATLNSPNPSNLCR